MRKLLLSLVTLLFLLIGAAPAGAETLVIDYSWTPPDFAAAQAVGYSGIIGYASNDYSKDLKPEQVAYAHALGMSVSIVWETYVSRPLEGFNAGCDDGTSLDIRMGSLGFPGGRTGYLAVDFDVVTSDVLEAVVAYFQGAATCSTRPVGVYGEADMGEAVLAWAPVRHFWQTTAWSRGRVSPQACLLQRVGFTVPDAGGSYDENVALCGDFGQWGGGTVASIPADAYGATVRLGSMGSAVVELQQALTNMNYAPGPIDGSFGPGTLDAVLRFQADAGLVADGIVGPATWAALAQAQAPPPVVPAPPDQPPTDNPKPPVDPPKDPTVEDPETPPVTVVTPAPSPTTTTVPGTVPPAPEQPGSRSPAAWAWAAWLVGLALLVVLAWRKYRKTSWDTD